jgi:hypothetical protein
MRVKEKKVLLIGILFKRNYYNIISKMIRQKEKLNSIRLEKMVIKYIKAV